VSAPTSLQHADARLETYRTTNLGTEQSRACARLHAASFSIAWDRADFEAFLNAGETVAHGAIDPADEGLVGLVMSRVAADEAEVLTLAVDPAHRRRGIARRLLIAHIECLAEAGAARLFLEVGTENVAARQLYAGFGFAQVGERKDYYRAVGAPPASARVLCLDLAPRGG
jgi:ribosomal-protein-alanine N-acetyltransferase